MWTVNFPVRKMQVQPKTWQMWHMVNFPEPEKNEQISTSNQKEWNMFRQLFIFIPDRFILKVWSTVKIRGTRVSQKAIVPVGRPRPYSIIILNMHFIHKASIRASSQITASSYILERHLWVNNSKPWPLPLLVRWLANKLTVLLWGCWNCLTPRLYWHPVNTKHLYALMQCWTNVEDVGPTLYKCYTNVLCLLGRRTFSQTLYIYSMLAQCWGNVADVGLALKQHWINVSFK